MKPSPATKALLHCVVHVVAVSMIILQALCVESLKEDNEYAALNAMQMQRYYRAMMAQDKEMLRSVPRYECRIYKGKPECRPVGLLSDPSPVQ